MIRLPSATAILLSAIVCFSLSLMNILPHSSEASSITNISSVNGSVWYAGKPVGTLHIDLKDPDGPGALLNITAALTKNPNPGKVYEGWLHDPKIFSTYDLSLGQFVNNTLHFEQFMINPDIYKYFVVSEEPIGDVNPRMSDVIVGGVQVDLTPETQGDIIGSMELNLPEYKSK